VLSNKIFASEANEILFRHVDEDKFIKKVKKRKKSGKMILMSQGSEGSLVACEDDGILLFYKY